MQDAQLTLVTSLDDLERFRRWLGERRNTLAIDTETTGLNVGVDRVRLVQVADESTGWAFPFDDWRGAIRELLRNYDREVVFWNSLFDLKMLAASDVRLPQHLVHDGMIMSHLVDPVRSNRLKDTAARLLGPEARAGQDALKKACKAGGWDWASVPVDHPAYWAYGVMDTVLTARVTQVLRDTARPYQRAYEVELAFIHLLLDAELAGMRIDVPYVRHAARHYSQLAQVIRDRLPFNPGSDAQVAKFLIDRGVPLTKRTQGGGLATDEMVLQPLAANVPEASLVIEYRSAINYADNYLRKMLRLADVAGLDIDLEDPYDASCDLSFSDVVARVHPSTKPVGARTGRTSVTDPPLQTVPRGRVVRDGFIPTDGYVIVLADYAGMELRAMAADAGEARMTEAFESGQDVHRWTAAQIFHAGGALELVTREQRDVTKNAGFAKVYGAGVAKFATTAGIDEAEARDFLTRYDQLFPAVMAWQQRLINETTSRRTQQEWGWVETPLGRKLPIEPGEEYKATNYRIQGGCAEVAKQRAVALDHAGLGQFYRLFVHDENQFEVPSDLADEVQHEVVRLMRDDETFGPRPALIAEGEVVDRWGAKYHDEPNPLLDEVYPGGLNS